MSIYEHLIPKVEVIEGWKWMVWRTEDGTEVRRLRICPVDFIPAPKPKKTQDLRTYHREYYRNVRREREGRAYRGPYKQKPRPISK